MTYTRRRKLPDIDNPITSLPSIEVSRFLVAFEQGFLDNVDFLEYLESRAELVIFREGGMVQLDGEVPEENHTVEECPHRTFTDLQTDMDLP